MKNFLEDLGLPKRLDLAQLSKVLNDHFQFEEERKILYLKSDTKVFEDVTDFEIILSDLGIKIAGKDILKTALRSKSLERKRWIAHKIEELPDWDGLDRIKQLSSFFTFTMEDQADAHLTVFRFWMMKSIEMVMYPDNINAVNRLVLTYQSTIQGIGKTTFARWLAEPFKRGTEPSIKELDYPDNTKDTRIELGKNFICLLDDVNSWDSKALKKFKGIISSKTINARLPYAPVSTYLARTASFIATTNEEGFLNESGNTRWAVFNLKSIDFDYNMIDRQQLWAQALHLVISSAPFFDDKVREYSIKSSEKHNIVTDLDEIVRHWFEFDPYGGQRSTELFEQIPFEEQKYFGYKGSVLPRFTKSLRRVFCEYGEELIYRSNGTNKWRITISTDRKLN